MPFGVEKILQLEPIKNIFKKYNVCYDRRNKIITVRDKINIKDFMYLKKMTKFLEWEVRDIRVGDRVYGKI